MYITITPPLHLPSSCIIKLLPRSLRRSPSILKQQFIPLFLIYSTVGEEGGYIRCEPSGAGEEEVGESGWGVEREGGGGEVGY